MRARRLLEERPQVVHRPEVDPGVILDGLVGAAEAAHAVGVERHAREVGGQAAADAVADRIARRRVCRRPAARNHGALLDLRQREQRGLDLPRLHAEPGHLELPIDPAEILERAGVRHPHAIPRAIPSLARTPRVRREPLVRQLRGSVIPASEPEARHPQLSRHTLGNGRQRLVQDLDTDVIGGHADGNAGARYPTQGRSGAPRTPRPPRSGRTRCRSRPPRAVAR